MSESNNPDAGIADTTPHDMMAAANALPDDAFELEEDEDAAATEENPAAPEPKPRKPKAPEPEPEGDEEPAADEGEEEPAEEEPEDGSDTEAEAEPEKPEAKKDGFVEIDGHQIPLDEVRRGFMRTADYTRKTQAIAEEARQVQTGKQEIEAQRNELGVILNVAVEALRSRMPAPPDPAMIRDNPLGYMEQTASYQAAVEEMNKLLSGQQQLGEQTTAEKAKAAKETESQTRAALQRENDALLQAMPELRNPEKAQTFFREAAQHGEHYGLKADDIAGIQDHRALRVLADAIAYRKLQAKAPAAVERVKAAPPIRPGVRQAPGTRSSQPQRQARDAFRRDPTIDGAVAILPDSAFGLD